MSTTRKIAALFALLFALLVPSAGAQSVVPGPFDSDPLSALEEPGDTLKLSDENKVTRWAHASELHPIRVAASSGAPTITRLRFLTEDKLPEVYLVLEGRLDAGGEPWLRIRIPMRPNGRTGWVPAEMMSQLYVVRTLLVVNRSTRRATLYKNGRRIWHALVGLGKSSSPTPRGNYWIRERLKGDGRVYGPWAFGTSAYSNISDWPNGGVVGIHGTNQPGLIPGNPSHGCVRVRNDKIRQLARLLPIGTPLRIIG